MRSEYIFFINVLSGDFMLNYIWGAIILVSIICAVFTGNIEALSSSILDGASDAINLIISMAGMMSLWTGLLKIAENGGLTYILARIFRPILQRLFKDYPEDSPAMRAICMNITANILGLGNAATPLGISAMKEMNKFNKRPGIANNSMVTFVVMNTASIQLIPTMMSILRQKYNSASPFDVVPSIWIASSTALFVGIILSKIFEK